MKTTGTNPGRGRLQTRLSEVSRYSWVNIYTYMAARQGESFSSAWEADLGGTPWNAVGVLNGVYRFMTCLKRRARNCPYSRSRYLYPAISSISINGRVRSTVRRFIASHFSPLLYNSTVGATFEIESCCFGTFFEINSVSRNRSYVFLKRVIILTIFETNGSLDGRAFSSSIAMRRITLPGDKHCRCDVASERKETERKVASLISLTSKFRSLDFG